jgi:low affinity Fe/Cu permease
MARKKKRSGKAVVAKSTTGNNHHSSTTGNNHHSGPSWFAWFATEIAHWTGKPAAFTVALGLVVIWAVTGPVFGYSDTWQLVINTSTTIVTFLMVFLIQNTQNRDTMALQIKLAELIFGMHGAKNKLATAEDLSDEELEALHEECRRRADETLASLNARRSAKSKTKSKAA